jgi:serine/threonine-protein kinase
MEGQRLSHYEIGERLGGGGMGVVYKALDTKLNRHVALKFLPPELTRDDDARQRFMQEAQAASALDHPNICTIHEIDSAPDGKLFIAMAFYDGETLKARISRGPLPVKAALDLAIQIGQGLAKAHANGIVHRDVKPANLMVTSDGFLKIVDFGIAKLMDVTGPTQTGTTLGTVSYMSPEQVEGKPADQKSDVSTRCSQARGRSRATVTGSSWPRSRTPSRRRLTRCGRRSPRTSSARSWARS